MKKRRFCLMLVTTVFIWTVPWVVQGQDETQIEHSTDNSLSKEELDYFLSLFSPKKSRKLRWSTPPTNSFLPTEIIRPTTLKKRMLKRKSSANSYKPIKRSQETTPTELLQQLTLLNSLMDPRESERKTNEKVNAIISQLDKGQGHVKSAPAREGSTNEQSLALLNSLLANKETQQAVDPSPPALRATSDKEAANMLVNLLMASKPDQEQQPKYQDFKSFSNTDVNMDAAASNQLSSLITLLGTLGSLGGGSQMSNLLNLAQPSQSPGILSGLLGNNRDVGNNGLFANMFAPQGQSSNNQFNALASLLGNQGSAATFQPNVQAPGVVPSLLGLGSSVSSLVGNSFRRLSGTRADGKPRVRGFDTRLGLGYRLGQAMDAQIMWEVGPQIFTTPLENEKRDHLLAASTAEQQMSPELQRQLEQLLSKNQLLQKREQEQVQSAAEAQKIKEELEHEQLGKLFHAEPQGAGSQYAARVIPPPNQAHMFPAPAQFHHIPFKPLPSYYMRRVPVPIVPPHRRRIPSLADIPGPAPVLRFFPRRNPPPLRPTISPITTLNMANSRSGNNIEPYEMLTDYEKSLLRNGGQGFSKRLSHYEENDHWELPSEILPTACPIGKGVEHSHESLPNQYEHISSNPGRRQTRKSDQKSELDGFASRMGNYEQPPRSPVPIGPFSHQLKAEEPIKMYGFAHRMASYNKPPRSPAPIGQFSHQSEEPIKTDGFASRMRTYEPPPRSPIGQFSHQLKSDEPIKMDGFANRMGIFDRRQLPLTPPYTPQLNYYPAQVPFYHGRRVAPAPQRRFYPPYFYPPQMRRQYHPMPPLNYRYPQHAPIYPPAAQPLANPFAQPITPPIPSGIQTIPAYNPHQNFIPESDDSFIRRNAIVTKGTKNGALLEDEQFGTMAQIPAGVETPPEAQTTAQEQNDCTDFDQNTKFDSKRRRMSMCKLEKPREMIGGMFKNVINHAHPVMRLLFPTTTLPPPNVNHTGGDYYPTQEPLLIATPAATPMLSLFDHFGRPRPTTVPPVVLNGIEPEANPYIHIGEGISYEELASTVDLSLRPRVRTYKNGTKTKVTKVEKGQGGQNSKDTISPPGMEMFIDIDSGEVSVRKPIASLVHFGDLTTTQKPKTDEEIEDEESLKIYERLQNHFKASMEEFQLQQEIKSATKEHKEKIKKEQDESLGMVNRYFDLLEDEGQGQEGQDQVDTTQA